MASHCALNLVLVDALPTRCSPACSRQVDRLLLRIGAGAPVAHTARHLRALYRTPEAGTAAWAQALADALWLAPEVLLRQSLPVAYWAGALDQLARQHAGGALLVVGSRALLDPPLRLLRRAGRACVRRRLRDGVCELDFLDGAATTPQTRREHDRGQRPRPAQSARRCAHRR